MSYGSSIGNPLAYNDAVQRKIKLNARKSRERKFAAAIANDPADFRFWVTSGLGQGLVGDEFTATNERIRKAYGDLPSFLYDAIMQWGGLTDGQLAFARKRFAEAAQKREQWAREDEARRATAQPWAAGRQRVVGTVQSVKEKYNAFGTVTKIVVATDDGRKLYVTRVACANVGDRIAFDVAVEPSKDDPTFAFGTRPTKGEVLVD